MAKDIKIGLIARADKTGLGVQSWELYRHISFDKVLIVDLEELNSYPSDYSLYLTKNCEICKGIPTDDQINRFLSDLKAVFTIETPYNYYLYQEAKKRGIKTILQANYEFFDYLSDENLPPPDIVAVPTFWHFNKMKEVCKKIKSQLIYLPVPIAVERFKFKKRNKIEKILHIAGTQAINDRNGTNLLLESLKDIKIPVIIKTIKPLTKVINSNKVIIDDVPKKYYWENYSEGDLFVLPRRYGGLCLPLNEALASGMVPLMLDISPVNRILPKECLVPAYKMFKFRVRDEITCYSADPKLISYYVKNLIEFDLSVINSWIKNYLFENSWQKLKPLYLKILCG